MVPVIRFFAGKLVREGLDDLVHDLNGLAKSVQIYFVGLFVDFLFENRAIQLVLDGFRHLVKFVF